MLLYCLRRSRLGNDPELTDPNRCHSHTTSRQEPIYTQLGSPAVCCLPVCSPLMSTTDHLPAPTNRTSPGSPWPWPDTQELLRGPPLPLVIPSPLLPKFKHSIPGTPLVSCSWSLQFSCPRLCRHHFLETASLGPKGHSLCHGDSSSPV